MNTQSNRIFWAGTENYFLFSSQHVVTEFNLLTCSYNPFFRTWMLHNYGLYHFSCFLRGDLYSDTCVGIHVIPNNNTCFISRMTRLKV